jgi:hypothetical protein
MLNTYSVPCDMYTSCVWDISIIRCFYHKAEIVIIFHACYISNPSHLYLIISLLETLYDFVCFWHDSPQWARAFSFTRFLDYTQRRTTVCRNIQGELSARHSDLYLITHNTHSWQISMARWDSNPQFQKANGGWPTP